MDYRNAFRNIHPFSKLVLLVLIMFVSFIVVIGIGLFAAMPFLGTEVLELLRGGDIDADNLQFLRYFQVLSHIGLFILPSIVFVLIVSQKPARYLEANHRPWLWPVLLSVLIMFTALPMVNYLMQLNNQISLPDSLRSLEEWMRTTENAAENLTKRFLQVHSWQEFMFNMLMIAVIPAIGEEFIFRGIIQKLFGQWTRNVHVAVFITAILFSAMHMQFYSFLPRVGLGMVLGYLLVFSGNIWIPVLAHFANNAAALIFYYYYDQGVFSVELEEIGAGPMAPALAISSLLVLIALFVAFRRASMKKRKKSA
jgi:uncharacterized protein